MASHGRRASYASAEDWDRRLIRSLLFALLLAFPAWGAEPVIVAPDRAWQERFRLFRVGAHTGLNYWGTTLQIAIFMTEDGPKRNEMGHDNLLTNLEAYVCPAVPAEDRRLMAATIAMNKALSSFVLSDRTRRNEFWKYWAEFYHAGGPAGDPVGRAENNAAYARLTGEVWRTRAVPWMAQHGIDKMRTHDLKPFTISLPASGTVWQPAEGM